MDWVGLLSWKRQFSNKFLVTFVIYIIITWKTLTVSWFMIHEEPYLSGQICVSVCWAFAVPESGSKSVVGYFWAPLPYHRTLCTAVRVVQCCSPHPILLLTIALHSVISHPVLYFKPPDGGPVRCQKTPRSLCGPEHGPPVLTRCQGNRPDVLWPHWNPALIIDKSLETYKTFLLFL